MKSLGLPPATELLIKASDTIPGWTVLGFISELVLSQGTRSGRALMIGHYAGHGGVNDKDQLYFVASPSDRHRVSYQSGLGGLLDPNQVPPDTDCCIIIDSCYSGTATRGSNAST